MKLQHNCVFDLNIVACTYSDVRIDIFIYILFDMFIRTSGSRACECYDGMSFDISM